MPVGLKKPVTVEIPRIRSLGTLTTLMDGSEMSILDITNNTTSMLSGYIDLSNMLVGDIVIIRMYARIFGVWRLYHDETYSGVQTLPLIYITPKPKSEGVRVSIQQTAGLYKMISYEFYEEL